MQMTQFFTVHLPECSVICCELITSNNIPQCNSSTFAWQACSRCVNTGVNPITDDRTHKNFPRLALGAHKAAAAQAVACSSFNARSAVGHEVFYNWTGPWSFGSHRIICQICHHAMAWPAAAHLLASGLLTSSEISLFSGLKGCTAPQCSQHKMTINLFI